MIIRTLVTALALLIVPLLNAAAQGHPQTREGFWIGFGLGAGSFGCEDCNDRETGGAGVFKLGGTLSPSVLLGAEANTWTKEVDGARVTHTNVSAMVQWYPTVAGGFHLKGGLGIASLEISAETGFGELSVGDDGFGLLLGLGYDGRVARNFSLTPFLNFLGGSFDGGNTSVVQLGLGFSWH